LGYAWQQFKNGTALKNTWRVASYPVTLMGPRDEASVARDLGAPILYTLFFFGYAPVSSWVVGGLLAGPKLAMFVANTTLGEKVMECKVKPFIGARLSQPKA
jgi:hypothetical protein